MDFLHVHLITFKFSRLFANYQPLLLFLIIESKIYEINLFLFQLRQTWAVYTVNLLIIEINWLTLVHNKL